MPVAEALMTEMERSATLQQHGIAGLREILREILLAALPEPAVKQQAAIVLGQGTTSQCSPGKSSSAPCASSPATASPEVTELRAALRDSPEFVQPERYRWQFGRPGRAMAGAPP